MAITESLGSEELSVAGAAMDLMIGSVASQSRIKGTMTLGTVEALFVPHGSLGQLLFGSKHCTTASRAALSFLRHDRSRIGIVEWPLCGDFILTAQVNRVGRYNKRHLGPDNSQILTSDHRFAGIRHHSRSRIRGVPTSCRSMFDSIRPCRVHRNQ